MLETGINSEINDSEFREISLDLRVCLYAQDMCYKIGKNRPKFGEIFSILKYYKS